MPLHHRKLRSCPVKIDEALLESKGQIFGESLTPHTPAFLMFFELYFGRTVCAPTRFTVLRLTRKTQFY